jgi:predicted lysophospholipase L1 biosynthesis ABC-type transport system permease subunit
MDNYKEDLKHIRTMMERSSTFISLSGMSGIVAGFIALCGAYEVYTLLVRHQIDYFDGKPNFYGLSLLKQLVLIGLITLGLALTSGVWFTVRKSRKNNLPLWSKTTRSVLLHLSIPLVAGGLFCLVLIFNNNFYLVAPLMLLFYGLALVNVSKYTLPEVFWLGICEAILGLCGVMWLGYGLLLWAIGFGLLHIAYGTYMHFKYDAK